MGFSPTSKAAGGLVFVGYGITAPELKYDDYAGLDVAGKIVVMIRRTPRASATGDQRFDTNVPVGEDSTHAAFATKIENAVAHKAAGVIIVNDTISAGTRDAIPQYVQHAIGTTPRRVPGAVLQARSARLDDRRRADQVGRRHRDAHRQGPETAIVRDQGLEARRRGDGESDRVQGARTSSACSKAAGRSRTRPSSSARTTTTSATAPSAASAGKPRGQDPLRRRRQRQRHHRPHRTRPPLRRDEGPQGPAHRVHRLHRGGTRAVRLDPLLQGAALPARQDGRDDQHGHDRPHEAGAGRLARPLGQEGPARDLRHRHRGHVQGTRRGRERRRPTSSSARMAAGHRAERPRLVLPQEGAGAVPLHRHARRVSPADRRAGEDQRAGDEEGRRPRAGIRPTNLTTVETKPKYQATRDPWIDPTEPRDRAGRKARDSASGRATTRARTAACWSKA